MTESTGELQWKSHWPSVCNNQWMRFDALVLWGRIKGCQCDGIISHAYAKNHACPRCNLDAVCIWAHIFCLHLPPEDDHGQMKIKCHFLCHFLIAIVFFSWYETFEYCICEFHSFLLQLISFISTNAFKCCMDPILWICYSWCYQLLITPGLRL